MIDAANYRAEEALPDGRPVVIRSQRPDDRDGYLAALKRVSADTLYRRFFVAKRWFSADEAHRFLDIDFVSQVALVAEVEESGKRALIGSSRYIVVQPGRAEVAFTVIDAYQRMGIGSVLLHHLALIGEQAGVKEFIAEVLADNTAMLRVFEHSGLHPRETRHGSVVDVTMRLPLEHPGVDS